MAQLESFLVLAEELHFGRAAARLGIAQSALSAQLRRLEAEVGAPLLVRTSRRVALTAAGEQVRTGAQRLLADAEQTVARARAAAAGRIGTVRVSGQAATMIGLIPQMIRRLVRAEPELVVDVRQQTTQAQIDALIAGTVDVAFIRGLEPHSGLRSETIFTDPVDAVLPSGHPLCEHDEVALAELADEPFVLWSRAGAPAYHDALIATCRDAGFSPRIAHEVMGCNVRQAFVAAGLGVALESRAHACARHRDVRFVPLAGQPLRARIDAAWHDSSASPLRELVLDAARAIGRRLESAPREPAGARAD